MRRTIKRFGMDTSGNVAMLFGLSVIPLFMAGGIAIDYSTALDVRTETQQAADSAALFVAAASGTGDKTELANKIFDQNFSTKSRAVVKGRVLTPRLIASSRGTEYTYDVTVEVPTRFMKLVGYDKITVAAMSKSAVEPANIEVVLALDSTGSMGRNGRMNALKRAAEDLVDKISAPTVKIAIVPFDTQVKLEGVVGLSGAFDTAANPFDSTVDCATISDANDRTACENAVRNTGTPPAGWTGTTQTVTTDPVTGAVTTVDIYDYANGTSVKITRVSAPPAADVVSTDFSPDAGASWLSAQGPVTSKSNGTVTANNDLLTSPGAPWYGCVIDRQQPNDANAVAPSPGNAPTTYPKANCATPNLATVMGLSNNKANLIAKINSLQPSGNTNITIGLQWAMEALTPSAPLTNATTTIPNLKRHIILVTDGDNTQNRWTTDRKEIDKRTAAACASAKSMENVTVHTIRLQEGNVGLLRSCASSPENFYDVANANGLNAAFEDILKKISNIRLTE